MPIAVNEAGDAVFLTPQGQWEPAQIAVNPQTKETLAFDGRDWQPIKTQPKSDYSWGDVGMAALRGVPIAGGLVEKNSTSESQATYKAFDEAHPWISGGAKFAGGIAALGPLGMTGLGARALGLTGSTLMRQVGNSALSGGVIGGLDAATRGQNPIQGGEIGAALGAASPIIGRGIGAAIAPVATTIRGIRDPSGEAARRVATAFSRDARVGGVGLDDAAYTAAQASGVPVANIDRGGELTRGLARSAANTSPEGRQVLNNVINDRFEGQSERVAGWLRNAFNYPDARAQQDAIDVVKKTVNRKNYALAYKEGDKPIWSPELERLAGSPAVENAIKSATTTWKDRAITEGFGGFRVPITVTPDGRVVFNKGPNGVPTYPNLQFWDYVRRELSDTASAANRAGRKEEASRIGDLARSMNSELDNIIPSYANARAGASRFFGAEDAIEAGQNFVTQNFAIPEARSVLSKMSPTERKLFQDGFVSRYIETIDKMGDRRNILNQIANSPAAKEKLNMALGPQKAAELEAALRIEGIMDLARSSVQGNSTTARQLAELGLAGGAYGLGTGGDILNPNPTALANAALVYGAMKGQSAINTNVSREIARLLASGDKNLIDRGVKMISAPPYLKALRNADMGLAQAGTTLAGRAMTGVF